MASLSASIEDPSPKMALRNRVTHGLPAALNACWKFRATGVWLSGAAATWLMILTRGSVAYLFSARSLRETVAVALGQHLDLGGVRHQPGQEVPGLVGNLGVLGDADAVTADEGRLAAVDARDGRDADLDRLIRRGEQRRRIRHHADLALLEVTDPGRAGLLLGSRAPPRRPR